MSANMKTKEGNEVMEDVNTETAWLRVREPEEDPRSNDVTKKADSFTFSNAGEITCMIKNAQVIGETG